MIRFGGTFLVVVLVATLCPAQAATLPKDDFGDVLPKRAGDEEEEVEQFRLLEMAFSLLEREVSLLMKQMRFNDVLRNGRYSAVEKAVRAQQQRLAEADLDAGEMLRMSKKDFT